MTDWGDRIRTCDLVLSKFPPSNLRQYPHMTGIRMTYELEAGIKSGSRIHQMYIKFS